MGKPWALEKEEKGKEVWPSLCEKNSQGAQKETRPRYLEIARTKGILGKCQEESAGIWTTQGSMLMDTRNKDRHVPSAAYDSRKESHAPLSSCIGPASCFFSHAHNNLMFSKETKARYWCSQIPKNYNISTFL